MLTYFLDFFNRRRGQVARANAATCGYAFSGGKRVLR